MPGCSPGSSAGDRPGRARDGDPGRAVAVVSDDRPAGGRRRKGRPGGPTVVLLPGPQRGGEPRGPGRGGAGGAPAIAETFEIIAVNDGSRDRTARDRGRARGRAPGHRPGRPPPHEPRLRGGAPLRASGRRATTSSAFTDGDRQFQVADLGPADRPPRSSRTRPTSSSGSGSSAPTRSSARSMPGPYRLANRLFFGLRVTRRRLRLQAVPARGARGAPRRVGRSILLGRARSSSSGPRADPWSRSASRTTRGRPAPRRAPSRRSCCAPSSDFWRLRLRLWANRDRALRRGRPLLSDSES